VQKANIKMISSRAAAIKNLLIGLMVVLFAKANSKSKPEIHPLKRFPNDRRTYLFVEYLAKKNRNESP
jgi:hypothetical protein